MPNKNIRIISRLDVKGPNIVKGIHTEGLRVVGNPVDLAIKYYQQNADEIIYLDIVASLYERNLDFDLLKSVAQNIFIPMTVGGGIRSLGDINNALRAGADKVAVNTFAVKHPEFLKSAVSQFGSQCIVLSVEAKKIGADNWEAYTDGGREKTGVDAVNWIKQAIDIGIGEIILTSIDMDGTKKGYELPLISRIAEFSPVPVIAHGGASGPESIAELFAKTNVDAASIASILHYDNYSISDIKAYLKEAHLKINLRI